MTWTVEGQPIDVGPGDALHIPRGAVHQFDNPTDVDAPRDDPPDYAVLGEAMSRHGLTCAV